MRSAVPYQALLWCGATQSFLAKARAYFPLIPAGSLLLLYGFSECCPAGVTKNKSAKAILIIGNGLE